MGMSILARSAMYLYIWKRYGNQIKRLTLFIIAILSIQVIHNEYLGYCSASNSIDWVGTSFVVKWILFCFITLIATCTPMKVKNDKKLVQDLGDRFDIIKKRDELKSRGDHILDS